MSEAAFGQALGALYAELDWDVLGDTYCHEGGESFFEPEQREALLDAGLHFASDLPGALAGLGEVATGRSVYVGAALFELPLILCERLVLERDVVWLNRPGREINELNRALTVVERRDGVALPRVATAELAALEPHTCDHVWLVSVLTDPEAFPALHDELYERAGTELATGRGDRAAEATHAAGLVERAFDALRLPGLLSTTDEELALVGAVARDRGLVLEVPERGRLTGIVGDVVRACRVTRAGNLP